MLVPLAAWWGYRAPIPAKDQGEATLPVPSPPSPALETAANLAGETLDSLLRQLGEAALGPERNDGQKLRIRLICARLAELDPVAGLEWIAKQNPDFSWDLRHPLLMEWALLDSRAAWNFIPEGPEGDRDRQAVTALLLHEDPEIFMEWFRRVRQPMPDGSPAWLKIAERFPDELLTIAGELLEQDSNPARPRCASFYQLLARFCAGKDPAGTLEWSMTLPSSVRTLALAGVMESWAGTDPRAAWQHLISLERGPGGFDMSRFDNLGIGERILAGIAREDPAAAMKAFIDAREKSSDLSRSGINAMRSVIGPAVASGKMSAVDAYRLLDSAKGTASILPLNVLDRIWFGTRPDLLETAARDISAQPDAMHRGTALRGIMAAWMKSDPDAAIGFAASLEDGRARSQMLAGVIGEVTGGGVDPDRQVDRFAMIPPEYLAGTYVAIATRSGQPVAGGRPGMFVDREASPDRIASLLSAAPASPDLNRAVGIAALKWGELDPSAALEWAGTLADPGARNAAYSAAIDGWSYHDPMAAAAWIGNADAGPCRDAATASLIRRLGTSDPAAAWEWTATIGEPALQSEQRVETLRAWSRQSPGDAQEAFQSYVGSLPPAQAAEFTRRYTAK
ncbi:hypothetical protein [Luteolibacter marinus]|uniref:hypothetical protein n=1 Tax=Luteolibacter marinus TaxID=2776705 RepID=UPI001865C83D|nr:hypothetical protein [Luteolibacter marinus]